MAIALTDTDPEADRVHLALLRGASPARRLRLALSLSDSVIALSRGALGRGVPAGGEPVAAALRFVAVHYGADLAAGIGRRLGRADR